MSNSIEMINKLEISIEDYIAKLKKLSTTALWDCSRGNASIIQAGIINYTPDIKLIGPAYLINTSDAIMPVLQALHYIQESYVLVVNDLSGETNALLGDIIVESAKLQRLSGIIVFGHIRDIDSIRKLCLPVWAKGNSINAARLGTVTGNFHAEIVVNNTVIKNGDWLMGDENGMIVIDQAKLRLVIKSAEVKSKKENMCLQKIHAGQKITTQMNLEAFLNNEGELVIEF